MRRRRAFTITELLVSMALIMFIMAILAEAFRAGLESFRQLKSVGDMDHKLRTASTILRRDLDAVVLKQSTKTNLKPSQLNTTLPPSSGFFTFGEDVGNCALAGQNQPSTPPFFITLQTPLSAQTLQQLAALTPGAMLRLVGPSPSFPPPGTSPYMEIAGPPLNSFPITVPTIYLTADPPTGATSVMWDIPNGKFDAPVIPGVPNSGPNASPSFPDADGLFSPFATTFKLHFAIDTSVIPSGNPLYRTARRENYLSAAAPSTIDPTNIGNAIIYSPLIFSSSPPVTSPAPPRRPPFEDTTNYLTQQAEVGYFMKPNGNTTPGGQKLHTLYRRQLALLNSTGSNSDWNTMNGTTPPSLLGLAGKYVVPVPGSLLDQLPIVTRHWPSDYYDFSGFPQYVTTGPSSAWTFMHFNNIADVSQPEKRALTYYAFNGLPSGLPFPAGWDAVFPIVGPVASGGRNEPQSVWGSDILLTDVLSFSVRVLASQKDFPALPVANGSNDPFLFPGTTYESQTDRVTNTANANAGIPNRIFHMIYGQYDTAYVKAFNDLNTQMPRPTVDIQFTTNIQALEILIRVWDQKTSRARQITILQPM